MCRCSIPVSSTLIQLQAPSILFHGPHFIPATAHTTPQLRRTLLRRAPLPQRARRAPQATRAGLHDSASSRQCLPVNHYLLFLGTFEGHTCTSPPLCLPPHTIWGKRHCLPWGSCAHTSNCWEVLLAAFFTAGEMYDTALAPHTWHGAQCRRGGGIGADGCLLVGSCATCHACLLPDLGCIPSHLPHPPHHTTTRMSISKLHRVCVIFFAAWDGSLFCPPHYYLTPYTTTTPTVTPKRQPSGGTRSGRHVRATESDTRAAWHGRQQT